MNKIYEFVGGPLDGGRFTPKEIDELYEDYGDGWSPDWSKEREAGGCVPREELDNKPQFKGYLGPMYDGLRLHCHFNEDGEFVKEQVYVLRYETQEVYDQLSS